MPNLIDQMEILKNLPDGALAGELNQPSGAVPPYLVLSEVNRRKDMRQRFSGQMALQKPQTTVAQDMSSSLAPPSGAAAGQGAPMAMPGGIGSPPAMPGAPMPAPTGIAAAAGYRNGGAVHYASGGYVGNLNDLIPPEPGTYIGGVPLPTGGNLGSYGYDPSQSAAAGIAGAIPAGANGIPIDMSAAGASTADVAPAISVVPSADNGLPPADGSIAAAPFGQDYSGLTKQYTKELADANAAKARDPWLALMQAGLSIAGGTSPYALSNIGTGGAEGLNTYTAMMKGDNANAHEATAGLMGIKAQQTKDQIEQADQANEAAKIALGVKTNQSPQGLFADEYAAASPEKKAAMMAALTRQPNAFGIAPDSGASDTMPGPPVPFGSPGTANALNLTGTVPTVLADGTQLTTKSAPLVARLPPGISEAGAKIFADKAERDPQYAAELASVLNYSADPKAIPARGSQNSIQRPQLLADAHRIDPTYDEMQFAARNTALKSFVGSGGNATSIQSMNNITGHLAELSDAYDGLQNSNIPGWNAVANTAKAATGAGPIKSFNDAATAVSTEMDRALKGGATDVTGVNAWRANLDSNSSPDQQKAAVTQALNLLDTRAASIKENYARSMGRPYTAPLLDSSSAAKLTAVAQKYGVDLSQYKNLLEGHASAAPGASNTGDAPATVANDADYNALPSGATFRGPDGHVRQKP